MTFGQGPLSVAVSYIQVLLLNSARQLAWGGRVLDLGPVPSGLGAIAFRSHTV